MVELKRLRRATGIWMLVIATASILTGSARAAFSDDTVPPAGARQMTALEVFQLYRDRSWQWQTGAGLMKGTDRVFSAWSDGEKGKAWAEGRWLITNEGMMCFKATWHTEQGAFPAKTCFAHLIASGTIYQKREPDGRWYVFRHATPKKDDEANKLVAADLVSQQRDMIRAALGTTPKPQQ